MSWIQAIATVVVAGAAVLAYLSNRRLLEATERQVDLGRATLKRQREPRLVPADPDYCRIGDEIETHAGPQVFRTRRVYIGLENAGIGLAIVNEASASSPERGVYNVWPPPAVPSGAQRLLKLTPPAGTPLEPRPGESIEVRVGYTGSDEVARTLDFTAQHYPGGEWLVREVGSDSA